MKKTKISTEEIRSTIEWIKNNPSSMPDSIRKIILTSLEALLSFLEPKNNQMRKFLEMMGLISKSEKGSNLSNQ